MSEKSVQNGKNESISIRPAADVVETPDGMEITFEIPGAAADRTELEIKDRLLSLTAHSALHRHGLPVIYRRAFYLSDAVDASGISAVAADGLLTVHIPKAENAKTHRIAIK